MSSLVASVLSVPQARPLAGIADLRRPLERLVELEAGLAERAVALAARQDDVHAADDEDDHAVRAEPARGSVVRTLMLAGSLLALWAVLVA